MKIGTRKIMICEGTNKPVEMEYLGKYFKSDNGHPGWLCLHD